MRQSILACSLTVLVACGGGNNGSGDDAPPTADANVDVDAPPIVEGQKFSVGYGPVTIQPGAEDTKCVLVRLGNASAIKVRQIHNALSSSSHHLIVYKDDMDTEERTTPFECAPFTGALNTTGRIAPIMITQKADDLLTLPERVAYTLDANQMIKIEMHFLNTTDAPQEARASVDFYAADPSKIDHEANILFIGSPDVDIAGGQTKTLKQFFTVPSSLDLSASNIFAITGHTHHYGTDMQVRVGASNAGPMTSVYAPQPFSWSEPETTVHTPPFSIPAGGGFEFECTWTNTGSQPVTFGESANDEMCFFWAYYYPSQGSKVCVHTDEYGGVDICCPGNQLCSLIEGMF
jgi:hypothetical protein